MTNEPMIDTTDAELEQAIERARSGFRDDSLLEAVGKSKKEMTPTSEVSIEGLLGDFPVKPCSDEEWRKVQSGQIDVEEWEDERNTYLRENLHKKSELPGAFERFTFDSFDAGASKSCALALEECRDYADDFKAREAAGEGLIIVGGVGSGKTHLAVATMHEIMAHHQTGVLFVTVPGLLAAERQSYNDNAENTSKMKAAMNASLLILDDLGAQRWSEWAEETLYYLINHRYAQGLSIIGTTNLSIEETDTRIGRRSFSRLAERCKWVECEAEDYRIRRLLG